MKYSFQPGFDVGVFARLKYHKLYVQPELVYSFQSTKYKFEMLGITPSAITDHSHNVNIPVLLGYNLLDVKLMNFRAFIGPEFNYVLSDNSNNKWRTPANIYGTIGAGIDIAMLTLDLRYSYAFNKVLKDEHLYPDAHNHVISLSLGWKFL